MLSPQPGLIQRNADFRKWSRMKTEFKTFSLPIEQKLEQTRMSLPDRSMASVFRLENHDYRRIRVSWREARKALKYEYRLLRRLENASDVIAELNAISDRSFEDDSPPLRGLDLGVAATVLTLSAMGSVTIASCNGGCFCDHHHEDHPLVIFFSQPKDKETLLNAAKSSGAGISNENGRLMVWANDIWDMHRFAKSLFLLRWKLKHRTRRPVVVSTPATQNSL
jgi:hypothetical protein